MTHANAAQALLILIADPKLEEALVDFLLQQNGVSGFTSAMVNGHGTSHADRPAPQLSLVEQITGRQRRVQFMLHAEQRVVQALIATLKAQFHQADMHYILMPVMEAQAI